MKTVVAQQKENKQSNDHSLQKAPAAREKIGEEPFNGAGTPIFLKRNLSVSNSSPPAIQRQAEKENEEELIHTNPLIQRRAEEVQEMTLSGVSAEKKPGKFGKIGQPTARQENEARQVAGRLQDRSPRDSIACKGAQGPCPDYAASAAVHSTAILRGGLPAAVNRALDLPGVPLPTTSRVYFEQRLGADLTPVRLRAGPEAARAARSVNARAFTLGQDIVLGSVAPTLNSAEGKRLLAHELAHTLQPDAGSILRRDVEGTAGDPSVRETPQERLRGLLTRLEDEALPGFQAALDALDEASVRAAGRHVLLVWHLIEVEHEVLARAIPTETSPRTASELPADLVTAHDRQRRALLAGIGPRRFRDSEVSGGLPAPMEVEDLGFYIWEQTETSAGLARDTAELLDLLGREDLEGSEQWTAVGLLRQHPNPTHFAFMLTAVRQTGHEARLERFHLAPRIALGMLRGAQPAVRRAMAAEPLAEPVTFAMLPSAGRVRLLLPASPREIAAELYGAEERWEDVLRPYNRGLLAGASGRHWLRSGTELIVDPQALVRRYQGIFLAGSQARREIERRGSEPYLALHPEGPLVVGNSVQVGIYWPNSAFGPYRLSWWVENDPAAVREQGVPARVDLGEGRMEWGTSPSDSIESSARVPGNHVVKCRMTSESEHDGETRVLSRTIVVMTLEERTEIAARYPRGPLSSPRHILEDLRAERDGLPEGATEQRAQLDRRIAAVEEEIREANAEARLYHGPERRASFTPIRAIYVSSEEAPKARPLQIFVAHDPAYVDSPDINLKLWDFTLEGAIRTYGASAPTYDRALPLLLRTFADDAPYPTGNIRFIDVDLSPFGPYRSRRETLTYPTDGGTLLAGALRALSMVFLGAGILGAVALQPQIALPAFILSGVLAGAAGSASLYDRLAHGDFEWDLQAGMDVLDIASALLTVGVASGVTTTVRGAGRMTVTGAVQLRIGQAQLGIMAGTHVAQISAAVESRNQDRVAEAVLRALGDGALVLIAHRAGRRLASAEPRPIAEPPAGRIRQTMSGTGGVGAPGRPGAPSPELAAHEQAVAETLRTGMGVRPPPVPRPGAAPLSEGMVRRNMPTLAEARRVFDEAVVRAPGREVGIYRNRRTGTYAVMVGDEGSVSHPVSRDYGVWTAVQHTHPNPSNVLTYRNPSPQDVGLAVEAARIEGRPHTEFIEHRLPTGGRTYTAVTARPDGSVTIEFQRPDGSRHRRSYARFNDYRADWLSRTRDVDPDPNNPEYRDLLRDIDDFYAGRRSERSTMSRAGREGPRTSREAHVESMAWWRSPGVTTETRFARHEQNFRSIAATLRNVAARPGSTIGPPNESVLTMPVDVFIRSRPVLNAELRAIERDAARNPALRRELTGFLEGRLEAGAREVGSRRPDLVEFFLDRGEVIVTDYTSHTSRVHRLKTAFYRDVMATMMMEQGGPRVSSLDINLQTGESVVRP